MGTLRKIRCLTLLTACQLLGSAAFAAPIPDISLGFTNSGAVNSGALNVTLAGSGSPVFSSTGGPGNTSEMTVSGSNYLDITPVSGNLTNLGGTAAVSYTIAMWINTSTAGGAYLYKGASTWGSNDEIFFLTSGTGNATGGTGLHVGGVQWSGGFVGGNTNITSGAWTHIAIVRSAGTDTFYVNGVADGTTATAMANAENGTQDIRIGFQNDSVGGDGVKSYVGSFSGINIYPTALAGSDIQTLMQSTPEPSALSMLAISVIGLLRRRSSLRLFC